jgi:hypothetical protein
MLKHRGLTLRQLHGALIVGQTFLFNNEITYLMQMEIRRSPSTGKRGEANACFALRRFDQSASGSNSIKNGNCGGCSRGGCSVINKGILTLLCSTSRS